MSYRKDRLSHVVRDVVSDAIANRVSDPRISRFTSVTRVELSPDLKFSDVYVSVMGSDNVARTTMRGLQSACGMIQTRLAKQLDIRQCPKIRFHLDEGIKQAIDTIRRIDELSGEKSAPTAASEDEPESCDASGVSRDVEPGPQSEDRP